MFISVEVLESSEHFTKYFGSSVLAWYPHDDSQPEQQG